MPYYLVCKEELAPDLHSQIAVPYIPPRDNVPDLGKRIFLVGPRSLKINFGEGAKQLIVEARRQTEIVCQGTRSEGLAVDNGINSSPPLTQRLLNRGEKIVVDSGSVMATEDPNVSLIFARTRNDLDDRMFSSVCKDVIAGVMTGAE